MSNTKREPLLSETQMRDMVTCGLDYVDEIRMVGAVRVNSWHESARAKDAELIQRLVDALDGLVEDRGGIIVAMRRSHKAIDAAKAAGFKPSDR